jgi:hypothetical protein
MNSKALRKHVLDLLRGEGAHPTFDEAVRGFPKALRGTRPGPVGRTAWQLLEHMRLAQWDILEFCRNPDHASPPWPAGYWPESETPPDSTAWSRSVQAFRRDRRQLEAMVQSGDLLESVPDPDGPPLLREVFLAAAHNSYHLGQLVLIRRGLGA